MPNRVTYSIDCTGRCLVGSIRRFIGEIKSGHDPRIAPTRNEAPTDVRNVATFLDAYLDRHLRPAGIRSLDRQKRLLDAALSMNTWEHKYVGPLMHDRIIGALELCCRRGEMLLIRTSASTGARGGSARRPAAPGDRSLRSPGDRALALAEGLRRLAHRT